MKSPEDTGCSLQVDGKGNLLVSQGYQYCHNIVFIENWQIELFIKHINDLKSKFIETGKPVQVEIF